jgi:hypothetical protein
MKNITVQLTDDTIVVTMPGTGYRVGFYKAADRPGLLRSDYSGDDGKSSISQVEFLAAAWEAANDRARQLGWIV